jgi:membrane protein implicated in regulation of membrane protease activity
MIPTNTEARAYGLLLIGMTVAFVVVLVLSGISAAKARQWRTEAERQRTLRRAERVARRPIPGPPSAMDRLDILVFDESPARRYLNDDTVQMRRVDGAT